MQSVKEGTHLRGAALLSRGNGYDTLRIGSPGDPTRAARFDAALALLGDAWFDLLDAGLRPAAGTA